MTGLNVLGDVFLCTLIRLGFFHTRWRLQMDTFSALLALCEGNPAVTGGFPLQWPVTWSFDVFFDLRLDKRLSKQSRRQWFETPSHPLWRHYISLSLLHATPWISNGARSIYVDTVHSYSSMPWHQWLQHECMIREIPLLCECSRQWMVPSQYMIFLNSDIPYSVVVTRKIFFKIPSTDTP